MAYKDPSDPRIKVIKNRHYRNNPEPYKERRRMQKAAVRQFIIEAKSSSCLDCGISYPSYVMDFDHRDPIDKDRNIAEAANRGWSIERLKIEIAKCDLVCANCHRIRTHK